MKKPTAKEIFYSTLQPWQTETVDNFEPELRENILKAMREYAKICCEEQRITCAVVVPDITFDSKSLKKKIAKARAPEFK